MNILVCGATGCVGSAMVQALQARGHHVVRGARHLPAGPRTLVIDYMQPRRPAHWARQLRALHIDAIVNCVGILMPGRGQSFERVHGDGPIELFRGAALAGVPRVVQVSALGVGAAGADAPYLRSKQRADDTLAALPLRAAVLRPSLVYGPRSQSAALFATLAGLPLVSLPGGGRQRLQPVHVYELAEAAARWLERPSAASAVYELGGADVLSYREMLACYRRAQGHGAALWLPLPMPLLAGAARLAEVLPQQVLCRDTVRLLAHGSVPAGNALPALLGRAPSGMAQGLAITPPAPWLKLRAELSPPVALLLRSALAFMWIYTAAVSLAFPDASGVMALLARCGFTGAAGDAALLASCALNLALGAWQLRRPSPGLDALQFGAIAGYTLAAAAGMPEMLLDHGAPLPKNLPLMAAALVLWLAHPAPALAVRGKPLRHVGQRQPHALDDARRAVR